MLFPYDPPILSLKEVGEDPPPLQDPNCRWKIEKIIEQPLVVLEFLAMGVPSHFEAENGRITSVTSLSFLSGDERFLKWMRIIVFTFFERRGEPQVEEAHPLTYLSGGREPQVKEDEVLRLLKERRGCRK